MNFTEAEKYVKDHFTKNLPWFVLTFILFFFFNIFIGV